MQRKCSQETRDLFGCSSKGHRLKRCLPQTMLFTGLMNTWLILDACEQELTSEDEGNRENDILGAWLLLSYFFHHLI